MELNKENTQAANNPLILYLPSKLVIEHTIYLNLFFKKNTLKYVVSEIIWQLVSKKMCEMIVYSVVY